MTPEQEWENYKTQVLDGSDELNKDSPISPEWLKEREKMAFLAGLVRGVAIPASERKQFQAQTILYVFDVGREIASARIVRGRV